MRIILFSRKQIAHTAKVITQLFDALEHYGFDWRINIEFAEYVREVIHKDIPDQMCYGATIGTQPQDTMMVCYGGDGTLLEGVHRLNGAEIPVLGINAGHLGFLTSVPDSGFDLIFSEIAHGNISLERRSMLSVEGDFGVECHRPRVCQECHDKKFSKQFLDAENSTHLALNEFAVQRYGAGMISVETYVDNQMVATYHGDGVLVSTPTGSTAYSLSAGGPVVAPTCACLVISPLAPHNLTMRPVVIPDSAEIRMKIHTRHSEGFVMLDNRTYSIAPDTEFTIRRAAHPILLAVPHNISFYDTLRDKMMWGVDIRS